MQWQKFLIVMVCSMRLPAKPRFRLSGCLIHGVGSRELVLLPCWVASRGGQTQVIYKTICEVLANHQAFPTECFWGGSREPRATMKNRWTGNQRIRFSKETVNFFLATHRRDVIPDILGVFLFFLEYQKNKMAPQVSSQMMADFSFFFSTLELWDVWGETRDVWGEVFESTFFFCLACFLLFGKHLCEPQRTSLKSMDGWKWWFPITSQNIKVWFHQWNW